MPRALFILDEKRAPVGRKAAPGKKAAAMYTLDSFMEEYGPEDGNTKWEASKPAEKEVDSGENDIRQIVLLTRKMVADISPNHPGILELVTKLVNLLPSEVIFRHDCHCLCQLSCVSPVKFFHLSHFIYRIRFSIFVCCVLHRE